MGVRESLIRRLDTIGLEFEAVQNTDRHITYKQGLLEELAGIKDFLSDPTIAQLVTDAGGEPFEIETRGIT